MAHRPLDHAGFRPEGRQRKLRIRVFKGEHAPAERAGIGVASHAHRKPCPGLRAGGSPLRQAGLGTAPLPRTAIRLAGPDEAPGPHRIPSTCLPRHGQALPDRGSLPRIKSRGDGFPEPGSPSRPPGREARLSQGGPAGPGRTASGPATQSSTHAMPYQRARTSNPTVCSAACVSLSRRVAFRPNDRSGAVAASGASRQPTL